MTKTCILRGILFYCILQTILADGHVNIQVEILQYDNPLGTSYHGENRTSERKCCDSGKIPTCNKTDSCDSQFVICIGSVSNGKCNSPQAITKILKDTISFRKSYDNSMMYSFTWDHWPSGLIRYIVDVIDKDVRMGDLIDSFTSTSEVKVATSYENSTSHVISLKNYVSLDLGIRIWCQDGYSGRDCSHKCSSQPFTICTKNNDVALLQSCNERDVCTIKLGPVTPVNFTPVVLRNHLTYFILKEICSDAHNIQVEILHFTLKGSVQFKASCDNTTLSGLQFTTHIYVLSLVNKAVLRTYFQNLPLIVPTVDKKLYAGTFYVDVKYVGLNTRWQSNHPIPSNYSAEISYKTAKPIFMTFTSGSKTFVLETLLWCDQHHYGEHCQYSNCMATGNKMCDNNGHFVCKPGYGGNHCTDLNECQTEHPCQNGGTCQNTHGSFSCKCKTGWTGRFCDVDIDECSLGLCTGVSNCINFPGRFHCTCARGFRGRYCIDSDECAHAASGHVCYHNSSCVNKYGSYYCNCPSEFTGQKCDIDVDECKMQVCHVNNTLSCRNTNGSYVCNCKPGWTGNNCEIDINECITSPCINGTCINTDGSFICRCYQGFAGKYCDQDFDECSIVTCANNGTCLNLPFPERYKCKCMDGWDGRKCSVDIDECYTIHPCKNNGKCQNSNGGYACACAVGWSGQTCSSDIDECQRYNPCSHGGVCNNIDGGYTCACPPNWEGPHCEVKIDSCTVMPCKNNGQCTNTQDGYTCLCSHRWTGTNCEYDVHDIIKSECTNSGWNISVDISVLRQLHPAITVNEIFFGDNSCKGQLIANHLVFLQGFQNCLTAEQQISSYEVLYRNILFSKTLDQMQSSPNMQTIWTYSVECKVGSFAATASHIKDKTRPPIHIESNSKSIDITFFKDPGFMIPLSGNPVRSIVGDDVYVKVFTTATNWNIKMRLDTCYVTSDVNIDNTPYYVIKHGCEVDSNTHIISESTHETRFVFQDFENVDKNGINIYCNATFCDSDDFSPGCAESCVLN